MKLNELKPKEGSTKNRIRVGRGIGSGKGKTGGRGVKGQKARTGVSINGFEGGQMPLYRRLPKSGFTNIFARDLVEVTLGRLQQAVDKKLIDPKKPVDEAALVAGKVIRRKKDGVKLLAKGELKTKLDLTLTAATRGAVAAVEKAGGKVELLAAFDDRQLRAVRTAALDRLLEHLPQQLLILGVLDVTLEILFARGFWCGCNADVGTRVVAKRAVTTAAQLKLDEILLDPDLGDQNFLAALE